LNQSIFSCPYLAQVACEDLPVKATENRFFADIDSLVIRITRAA